MLALSLKLAMGLAAADAVGTAAAWAAFLSPWTMACALLTRSAAGCGALNFLLGLGLLALSGGIVPPVLLPEGLGWAGELSPVAWMRSLAAGPLGYSEAGRPLAALLGGAAVLCALSAWLYVRRFDREEAS